MHASLSYDQEPAGDVLQLSGGILNAEGPLPEVLKLLAHHATTSGKKRDTGTFMA